jgi:diguanylate cyclase (GGDEF)-like protein
VPHALTAAPDRSLERRLTIAYVVALSIVALLTLASHAVLTSVLKTQDGSAAVINVSGRQRMLSQRIASLAAQYALGDAAAGAPLKAATDQFERQHESLIHGDPSLGLSAPRSPELKALYFLSGPDSLNSEVRQYIAEARQVGAFPPGDARMKPILTRIFAQARAPLLHGLEAVVAIHQQESEREVAKLEGIQDATLIVVLLTLLLEALAIFRPLVRRVSRYAGQLVTLATIDPLTGVLNRRSFFERGALSLEQACREASVVSALMIDADHFKRVNDTYSHAAGDAVLKALAATLSHETRGTDLIGRLGGEEFAVLLPRTTLAAAQQTAERLRLAIDGLAVETGGAAIRFSVSIGIAGAVGNADGLDALLACADRALYRAKANGRNRVETAA